MPLLHHYTDLAGLAGIAVSGTLWATNFLEVNDKTEYFYAWNVIQRRAMEYAMARVPEEIKKKDAPSISQLAEEATELFRDQLKSAITDPYGHLFMSSFARGKTKDHDDRGILTLWDRYHHKKGYCLQFDEGDLRDLLHGELMKGSYAAADLRTVTYGVDEDEWEFNRLCAQVGEQFLVQMARAHGHYRIKPDYQNHWPPSVLIGKLMDYCGSRKDPFFEDEREKRIFAYPADQAVVRVFAGIAGPKKIRTRPSGKRHIVLGEFWRPGISPRRVLVGPEADPDIEKIISQFHRPPVIIRPKVPIV